jgi:hypothetical protein
VAHRNDPKLKRYHTYQLDKIVQTNGLITHMDMVAALDAILKPLMLQNNVTRATPKLQSRVTPALQQLQTRVENPSHILQSHVPLPLHSMQHQVKHLAHS